MFGCFNGTVGQPPLSDSPVQFRVDPPRYQRGKPANPARGGFVLSRRREAVGLRRLDTIPERRRGVTR